MRGKEYRCLAYGQSTCALYQKSAAACVWLCISLAFCFVSVCPISEWSVSVAILKRMFCGQDPEGFEMAILKQQQPPVALKEEAL